MAILKKKRLIWGNAEYLIIPDPGTRLGSGGATLNALLIGAEVLSAQAGFTTVNGDIFKSCLVLVVHFGRSFAYLPQGMGFLCLPCHEKHSIFNLPSHLLNIMDVCNA
ncbi:unnamed protein product, partial [Darwinula stevensoni]